jgi:4-amino-4-deoxy-L-arabinose transferase-like glycosyltransferase
LALDVVRDVANLAALAVLCYPNRLLSTILPFSDVPSSLLWGVGFMEFLKSLAGNRSRSHALLSGLLMGAASLVRANGLLLVPVFLVRFVTWKREGFPRAAASMLLVVGVSVVVLP